MDKKKFFANLITGFVIAIAVCFIGWASERSLIHKLCDGCFVAAVVLLGVGGLKFARNAGTFDIMAYGLSSALHMMLPWLQGEKKDADFAAYKERVRETRKPARDLLLPGVIYLGLAMVFLFIYMATT